MYPLTQHWVPTPITARTVEEGPRIETAIRTNSKDIKHRTFTDVMGVPPDRDLNTIAPYRAYGVDEPQLKNGKTIIKLLLGGEKGPNGTINAPIHSVVKVEGNIWCLRGYTHTAAALVAQVHDRIEYALRNQLELAPLQVLRVDDKYIWAEIA